MTNEEIARRFERLALLMEIRGEDRFRVRSYRNAAEVIETWPEPLERIARSLSSMPPALRAEVGGSVVVRFPQKP